MCSLNIDTKWSSIVKDLFSGIMGNGLVAQLVRASLLHREGRRFESCPVHTINRFHKKVVFS